MVRFEGLQFARSNSMLFIEASEKTKDGIECAVQELAEKILQTPGLLDKKATNDNVSLLHPRIYSTRNFGCALL